MPTLTFNISTNDNIINEAGIYVDDVLVGTTTSQTYDLVISDTDYTNNWANTEKNIKVVLVRTSDYPEFIRQVKFPSSYNTYNEKDWDIKFVNINNPSVLECDFLVMEYPCTTDKVAVSLVAQNYTTYNWYWGDGNFTSGLVSYYNYTATGTFTITSEITHCGIGEDFPEEPLELACPDCEEPIEIARQYGRFLVTFPAETNPAAVNQSAMRAGLSGASFTTAGIVIDTSSGLPPITNAELIGATFNTILQPTNLGAGSVTLTVTGVARYLLADNTNVNYNSWGYSLTINTSADNTIVAGEYGFALVEMTLTDGRVYLIGIDLIVQPNL